MDQDTLLRQLADAFARNLPALTIELGRLYLADTPVEPIALSMVGQAYTEVGRYVDAQMVLERYLEVCDADWRARAFLLLGHLSKAKSEIGAAESHYRQAIELLPDDTRGYIYLGGMLASNGRLDEAEGLLRRAAKCAEGDLDEAYLNLGMILRAKGDYLHALVALRESLALDPFDTDTQDAIIDIESVLFEFPQE